MPKVKLTSENASLVVDHVRLTQKDPYAEVSVELARKFFDTGKVEVICVTDDNGLPVDPPFSEDEVLDVTELDVTSDNLTEAASDTVPHSDENSEAEIVVDEVTQLTAEMIMAATSKAALVKLSEEYGVDLSGCSNNDDRRAALTAALEQ